MIVGSITLYLHWKKIKNDVLGFLIKLCWILTLEQGLESIDIWFLTNNTNKVQQI